MKLNNISINALSILWHNHSKTTRSACSLHCVYLPLKNQSQISKQPWHQRLKNTQFWMAESIFALMTFSPMVFSRKHWFFQIIGLYQFWARMILTSYTTFKPLSTNNPRLTPWKHQKTAGGTLAHHACASHITQKHLWQILPSKTFCLKTFYHLAKKSKFVIHWKK